MKTAGVPATFFAEGENFMLDKYWKQFKSGTDIRGVAVEGVPGEPVNLTDEVIETIAAAFWCGWSDTCKRNPLA